MIVIWWLEWRATFTLVIGESQHGIHGSLACSHYIWQETLPYAIAASFHELDSHTPTIELNKHCALCVQYK